MTVTVAGTACRTANVVTTTTTTIIVTMTGMMRIAAGNGEGNYGKNGYEQTGRKRDLICDQALTDRDVHDGRPVIVQIVERESLWERFYSLL